MSFPRTLLALLLALCAPAASWLGADNPFPARASLGAWAAAAFVALASWPRACSPRAPPVEGEPRPALAALAFLAPALPALSLGLALDRERALDFEPIGGAVAAVFLAFLLAWAGGRAPADAREQTLRTWGWFALIVLPVALFAAARAALPEPAPPLLRRWFLASPLGWSLARLGGEGSWAQFLWPLGLCALLHGPLGGRGRIPRAGTSLPMICCLALQAPATRIAWAEVELRGPLTELRLELEGAGATRLTRDVPEGELRQFMLPLPAPAAGLRAPVRWTWRGSGQARWRGTDSAPAPPASELPPDSASAEEARVQRWERLPQALRSRPRLPPADGGSPLARTSPATWALALSAGWLAIVLRRRPARALLVGAAAAAGIAGFGITRERGATPIAVLECEIPAPGAEPAQGPAWLLAQSAPSRLRLGAGRLLWLRSDPPAATLECALDPTQPQSPEIRAEADLLSLEELAGADWELSSAANGLADFAAVWTRDPGGDAPWVARGAWPRSQRLPSLEEQTPSPGGPPGWLIAGLPWGRAALVARLAADDPLSAKLGLDQDGQVWVRALGWPD